MRLTSVRVQILVCLSIVFCTLIKHANAQVLNLAQAGLMEGGVGAVPNLNGAWLTAVQGNYAYTLGSGDALEITDITIPGLPQNKGRIVNGEGGASIFSPRAMAVSGNYVYIANFHGSSIEIIDVSDPALPKHKGLITHQSRTAVGQPFLNRPNGIFVLGNYAYVAVNGDGGGLEIIDISDPATPVHKSKLISGGSVALNEAIGIHVAPIKNKLYAFIAVSFTNSVVVVDVTNPANPVQARVITHANINFPASVVVSGNSLFVSSLSTSTVTKWNVADPSTTAPTLTATASNPGGAGNTTGYLYRPTWVTVSGKYVYSWSETGSIVLADTTNLSIGPLATVTHPSMAASITAARRIAVQGDYVYVPANALVIVEASNPVSIRPFIKTTVASGPGGAMMGAPTGVFVYEDHAYVASSHGNLEILDASDPTALKHVSSVAIGAPGAGPRSVYVFDDYAYLVNSSSLEIVDVANPAAPIWKGKILDGGAGAPYLDEPNQVVVARGTFDGKPYAYVASTSSNALEIIDVSNPAAPVHFGSIVDGQGGATLNGPTHVFVLNEYAYVLSNGTHAVHGGARGALEIVNVAFPNVPAHVKSVGSVGSNFGNLAAPYIRGGNNITVASSGTSLFAYIVDPFRSAFQIVDVTTPGTAFLKSSMLNSATPVSNLAWPRGVTVSGNYALVAYSFGVEAINIANTSAPTHHSFFQTGMGNSQLDYPTSIHLSGKYAYLSNLGATSNINVVDIYSPGITNFNPKTGLPGTPVTITGINFNTFVTASLNGVGVPIADVTNTTMNVTIPGNTSIGKLTLSYNNQKVNTATNFVVTPTSAAAASINQTGFTANWSNVGATNYFLDISTTNFSTFVTGYNNRSVGNVTTFSPADLAPGTTYQYRVRSNDGTSNSTSSAAITVQTVAATPTANAATSIGQNNFTFSWNAVASATDYYVDVATDAGFNTMVGNYINQKVSGTSLTVSALAPGTTYYYRVRSGNAGGVSVSSTAPSTITLPSSPTALQPSATTTSGFTTNWDAIVGAAGYRIDISTDNFASFVTGFENKDLGSVLTVTATLSASTVYQFRLKAYNASGTSPNSNIVSVLTLTPTPTAQPTNLLFSNVESTSVTVSYTAANGNPNGYIALRSNSATLTAAPANGTTYSLGSDIGNAKVAYVGSGVSFFDGGLPTSERYYYYVFAFNGTGVASNYRTSQPLAGSIVLDSETPTISIATVPNPLTITSGNTPIFNAKITDNVGVASAQIHYKGISRRDFKTAPLSLSGATGSNYSVQIQTDWYDSLGLEYYFSAKDETGNTSVRPTSSFVQLVNTSMSLPALPSGDGEGSYRIVSFPYQLAGGNSIASVYANVEWDDDTQSGLWWWNPSLNNGAGGYDKYGRNPSLQTIEPGKGYWVITRSPVTPQLSNVPAPRYNRSNLFQMTLKPGWNQVGNPYPVPLSWEDVRAFNQRINPTASFSKLTTWNGTALAEASDNTKLKAYEGGFVKNLTSTDITILIPFPDQDDIGGRTPGMSTDLNTDEWKIFLHISQGGLENKLGGFGMHRSAEIGEDRYDSFSPPMLMDIPELMFSNKNRKGFLSSDVIGTTDEFTWSFTPHGTFGELVQITWSNDITVPPGKQLLLFDEETLNLIDMTEQDSYTFNLNPISKFRIFYGRDVRTKVFSENIAASTPFPNPVNNDGRASVKLSLPDEAADYSVTIRVFNMQGKQMHSLTKTFKPGLHQFDVDLSSEQSPPGVYFYKLHVASSKSEKTLTGKIVKP